LPKEQVSLLAVSEFQSLFQKYNAENLQRATEQTELRGDFFEGVIWRLKNSI